MLTLPPSWRIALLAAPLLLAGCNDPSAEIAALRARIDTEQRRAEAERETQAATLHKLDTRLSDLEARLGKAGAKNTLADEVAALRREFDTLAGGEGKPGVVERLDKLAERVEVAKKEAVAEATAKGGSTVEGGGPVDEAKILELAKKAAREEATLNQPTKNFNQAMARLSASEAEKQRVKDEIIQTKQQMLELLETPTEDGRHPGEEILDAFIAANFAPEEAKGDMTQKAFAKYIEFAGMKVPGDASGRTYGEVMAEIKKDNRDKISRILSKEDQAILDRAHADWSDLEIGEGDPFGPLFMERVKKYQEANKK